MADSIVYLNGKFLPSNLAKVSVFDRGFLFGDGVYEVIPVYNGNPFYLSEHLDRLQSSLAAIGLRLPMELVQLEKTMFELLQRNNVVDGDYSIYVQITRGISYPRNFYVPQDLKPTIFAALKPITTPTYEELSLGKTAITLPDIRWQYGHIKTISLLPSVLLLQQVQASGCDEGILLHDGYAVEGITSNLFIVTKGKIITPPLSQDNLGGITRELVLQLLKRKKIACTVKRVSVEDLVTADEVWITSSTRGIFPIVKLDDKLVGSGKPGPIWKMVHRHFILTVARSYKSQLSDCTEQSIRTH